MTLADSIREAERKVVECAVELRDSYDYDPREGGTYSVSWEDALAKCVDALLALREMSTRPSNPTNLESPCCGSPVNVEYDQDSFAGASQAHYWYECSECGVAISLMECRERGGDQ